jgi:hypothetical protein
VHCSATGSCWLDIKSLLLSDRATIQSSPEIGPIIYQMDGKFAHDFLGFGAMDGQFTHEFMGSELMDGEFRFEFIGFEILDGQFAHELIGLATS